MKNYVIGDIHGKIEIVHKVLKLDGHKIFVGDILDSFDRSIDDQIESLQDIMRACREGSATLLPGNHEISYCIPKMRASGYKFATEVHFEMLRRELQTKIWKPFVIVDDILITHAGLTLQIVESFGINRDNVELILSDWWETEESPFFWIGRSRGGRDKVGGPLWCDWDMEFKDPFEVVGLRQICGHTRARKNIIDHFRPTEYKSVCIDVLDHYDGQIVEIIDGHIIEVLL